jgi:hypothetical protein
MPAIMLSYGKISTQNIRNPKVIATYGVALTQNIKDPKAISAYGEILTLVYRPTSLLIGKILCESNIWPHKTYSCNQVHVCKVSVAEIQRAVDVDKYKYYA